MQPNSIGPIIGQMVSPISIKSKFRVASYALSKTFIEINSSLSNNFVVLKPIHKPKLCVQVQINGKVQGFPTAVPIAEATIFDLMQLNII